jgi:benzoate/toluate 1,2-dioxygenase beta subunit
MRLPRSDAEDFLFHEARLLDERRFEEWLDLFAVGGIYWLPIREGASPNAATSLIYDEAVRRKERVYRLMQTPAQAQTPPSRTRHCITNVQVEDGPADDVQVYSNQVIYEIQPNIARPLSSSERAPRVFVGSCEHRLRPDAQGWLIALKKLVLLTRDQPIDNLTFIL